MVFHLDFIFILHLFFLHGFTLNLFFNFNFKINVTVMQRYPRPLLVEINLTNVFVEEASVALYKRIEEHILSTMRLNIGNKRVSSVPKC